MVSFGGSRSKTTRKGSRRKGPRRVQCYHCRHRFEVGASAESTNCPSCSQRVIVGDVIVSAILPVKRVQTCGRIVIKPKGRVNAELIEAHEGLDVNGGLFGNVLSGGAVVIGPKARWHGDCHAPSVTIDPGARIEGGRFVVPDTSLGLEDLADPPPEAAEDAEPEEAAFAKPAAKGRKKRTSRKAAAGKAAAGKSGKDEASAGKAAVRKASAGKTATGKTGSRKTSTRKRASRKASASNASASNASASNASTGKASTGKASAGKSGARKSTP